MIYVPEASTVTELHCDYYLNEYYSKGHFECWFEMDGHKYIVGIFQHDENCPKCIIED